MGHPSGDVNAVLTRDGRVPIWRLDARGAPKVDRPFPDAPASRDAYRCLDWSVRRNHLGGQLADALCQHFTQQGWLHRGSGRAVDIAVSGQRELLPRLHEDMP